MSDRSIRRVEPDSDGNQEGLARGFAESGQKWRARQDSKPATPGLEDRGAIPLSYGHVRIVRVRCTAKSVSVNRFALDESLLFEPR